MVPQQRRRRRRGLGRTAERRVVVARGPGGFGFTIAGQRPCVVSAVAADGPAARAGLQAGDALLAVDGAGVARAPHAAVARLVAGAVGPIVLAVALPPRLPPPTDTEDTEPDERARTRRRHPPPRRHARPINTHHPGSAGPSTSAVSAALQQLGRAASLECRAALGYLGTIETPVACSSGAPGSVRAAVKKLRQERRVATPVLLAVQPDALLLRRARDQPLAQYPRARILYAGCGSDADRRYFGLVTAPGADAAHSCHVFAVDPRLADHEAHAERAQQFHIECTRDPVAERCLEFPPSAEYVVGVIRGMYSLPPDDHPSPTLQQISKLAVKGDSPSVGNFARCSRAVFRVPRDRRARQEEARPHGPEVPSPQPSNHSEITTTSSNSDSGIGFHNDCRNIADRILVVEFASQQPEKPPSRFRPVVPRRPIGLVGCAHFDGEGSFLSNTTPVVEGFGGLERPLNLDDVMLNSNELQSMRHPSPRTYDDYNYSSIYSNLPPQSGGRADEAETQSYCSMPSELEEVAERLDCAKIEHWQSAESLEEATVVSGAESASSRGSRLQGSLDDIVALHRKPPPHEHTFLHPATVHIKVRKSKPLGLVWKTLGGRRRARALSGDAADKPRKEAPLPTAASEPDLRDYKSPPATCPAPLLSSARRTTLLDDSGGARWCAGGDCTAVLLADRASKRLRFAVGRPAMDQPVQSGGTTLDSWAARLSRLLARRRAAKKKMIEETADASTSAAGADSCADKPAWKGGVARWALGLDQLLADPMGIAAFTHFLAKEFAGENIRFWTACEQYAKTDDSEKRATLAAQIWATHLADSAPEPVNVDASARNNAEAQLLVKPPPRDLFRQAQSHIYSMMRLDAFHRFLKSDIHAECARADLSGLPSPYLRVQTEGNGSPIALKKSTSSTSERRRSGGSLLPWKRAVSRDRSTDAALSSDPRPSTSGAPAPSVPLTKLRAMPFVMQQVPPLAAPRAVPPAAPPAAPPVAPRPAPRAGLAHRPHIQEVMMGAGGAVGLCRVVMPDGATSVVGVERAQCVRDVVERLLARRHLRAPAYDVIATADPQRAVVDPGASAMCLAGREVAVEERAVVRFRVGGRAVGVRCRAARRLRRVLRLLLPLAPPPPPRHRAVVAADAHWLHPDSRMCDLHAQWLTVHHVPGDAAHSPTLDHDHDDLYDVLIVTDEDQLLTDPRFDAIRSRPTAESVQPKSRAAISSQPSGHAVSPGGGAASAEGGGTDPTARARDPTAATELDLRRARSDSMSAARGGGPSQVVAQVHAPPAARVRASVRPGTPIYMSPPEFPDKLWQKRGQIPEDKAVDGPCTLGPMPGPGTPPPPLPPKPARLPTFV